MKKPLITAHCLIKNEERWIWYAINSIIDYVDKIIIFDTGSTDNTVPIIKTIKNKKIQFKEMGNVNRKEFTKLRQEMINLTRTSWFMVLDGDEIWSKNAILHLKERIIQAPKRLKAILVSQWACLGDIYHFSRTLSELKQPGVPKNINGYYSTRAIKIISGLHAVGEYGYETYAYTNGNLISDLPNHQRLFLNHKLFHMTFLPRSSTRQKDQEVMMRQTKTLYYTGDPFPKSMKYPEVFYLDRPKIVPSPWKKFIWIDWVKGLWFVFHKSFSNLFIN